MKANLYVQGHYWATIDIPDDSTLSLLAKGMAAHAQTAAHLLKQELDLLDDISCTISLRYKHTVACHNKKYLP